MPWRSLPFGHMIPRPMTTRARMTLLLLLAAPAVLIAYGTRIHRLLPSRTLPIRADSAPLPVARAADLEAFRSWFYERASHARDSATRHTFLLRYPTAAAFTSSALKELLMMDGTARVLGIDWAPDSVVPLLKALELGSTWPDLDRRNQGRLFRDPSGLVHLTTAGDTVPFDPMTLNMGRLTGLSSQAHGHMGLAPTATSADPETLKKEPWNFATAVAFGTRVETFAPDNAQIYTDLAVLAAMDGRPAWRTLSALYAGNAMHYLADVGNAVHTIQVGIYPVFVDATIQSWMRRALTLFGLLGKAPTRNSIGIDIISNLHTYSERLFETELTGPDSALPSMQPALAALRDGNDSLARVLSGVRRADFGRAIAQVTIESNMRDGAEVYRVTREIIARPLRLGKRTVDFDTVPDERVASYQRSGRAAQLDTFNLVHARGLARTTSALRAWWSRYSASSRVRPRDRAAAIDAIMSRLLKERLAYLDSAESRRREWIASHGGLR